MRGGYGAGRCVTYFERSPVSVFGCELAGLWQLPHIELRVVAHIVRASVGRWYDNRQRPNGQLLVHADVWCPVVRM